MTASDVDVLDLTVGQVSGSAPAELASVLHGALDPPLNGYTAPAGLIAARSAVADALSLTEGPASVVMTAGASGAFLAFLLVSRGTRPRPRIALPDPCYPGFLNTCRRLGIEVDLYRTSGPRILADSFAAALTDQTIGAAVISPGNPTGVVADSGDVLAAEQVAAAHDIPVVLDECYTDLVDPSQPQAHLVQLHQRTVRLRSFSKCFALSGHRIGALITDPALADTFAQAHFAALMSAPTVSQVLAAACLEPAVSEPFLSSTRARLADRHTAMRAAVDQVPSAWVEPADVGVFAWVRGPVGGRLTAQRLAQLGVHVVPGAVFGPSNENNLRVLADIPDPLIGRFASALALAMPHE